MDVRLVNGAVVRDLPNEAGPLLVQHLESALPDQTNKQ